MQHSKSGLDSGCLDSHEAGFQTIVVIGAGNAGMGALSLMFNVPFLGRLDAQTKPHLHLLPQPVEDYSRPTLKTSALPRKTPLICIFFFCCCGSQRADVGPY